MKIALKFALLCSLAANIHGSPGNPSTGLPSSSIPLKIQANRVLSNLREKSSDLEKYVYLRTIAESNEDLYFATLINNVAEGEYEWGIEWHLRSSTDSAAPPSLNVFTSRTRSDAHCVHAHSRAGLPEVLPNLHVPVDPVAVERPLRESFGLGVSLFCFGLVP